MLRFCEKETVSRQDYESALTREPLCFDSHIWEGRTERFKYHRHDDVNSFVIPVIDEHGEIICLAYQDNEANRELRMLKELRKNETARNLRMCFPNIKKS